MLIQFKRAKTISMHDGKKNNKKFMVDSSE